MYYKREGKEQWLEPAKVVFQDGKVIFVRHMGIFVRVGITKQIDIDTQNGYISRNKRIMTLNFH